MHRTGHEEVRSSRPWLWTALAGLTVVAGAMWIARPQPAACQATTTSITTVKVVPPIVQPSPIAPEQLPVLEERLPEESREARFYHFSQGVACSFPDLPLDGYYIGVPTGEYDSSAACGTYVDIDGPLGSVRAQIVDRCPGCAPHQYDLSAAAFEQIADPAAGVARIRISKVRNPTPPPTLSYRVQQGVSADWLGLLFANSGNPLRQVALRPESGGDWRPLRRGYDNYWSASGLGPGPFTAMVSDIYGHDVLVPGIVLEPARVRYTDVALYELPAAPLPDPPTPIPVTTLVTTVVPPTRSCD
ncbi:expansin EXLX1 family cellulose-binding protein [Nocardia sp. CC227C]|uniref:expansin EXLX1 family cellulose-binding protein n=1 Tax=Nocardia sp. CC227C TaxID=3044562 RepID=UPI00278BEFA3|nr:expansin EXLX1 family cellulose-binding protein [Nocardia sp. CC227C]